MGSAAGVSEAKLLALDDWTASELFSPRERAALAYADAITRSDEDVDDALFAEVQTFFERDALVELTAAIAWENASSKFNRALRVESQELWQRRG